jgi:hypothetical protein
MEFKNFDYLDGFRNVTYVFPCQPFITGFRVNLQFCAIFSGLSGGTFGSLQQTWVRITES